MSFKFKDYGIKNNLPKYLLIIVGILAAIFLQWMAVPILLVAYVIVSLAFKNRIA